MRVLDRETPESKPKLYQLGEQLVECIDDTVIWDPPPGKESEDYADQ